MDADRARMVARLEEAGVVRDPRVANALRRVPRERFVPREFERQAFVDAPVGLAEGQTVSAPHMVAIMLEALDLAPGQRVLEVGAGSGYHAACLAELVAPTGRVVTVERIPSLARTARANLASAGRLGRVDVVLADGSRRFARPVFDRVSVAAAAPRVPQALVDALAPGGVLLVPVGDLDGQELVKVVKTATGTDTHRLGGVRFVPLVGEEGWNL